MSKTRETKIFVVFFPNSMHTFVCDSLEEAISCAEIAISMSELNPYFIIKEF